MKRRDLIKMLENMGCILVRHGGRHDWYTNPEEPLIKSFASRVLMKRGYIPGGRRRSYPVIRSQGAQHRRWPFFIKTRMGAGFPSGLLCCKACEGERPFPSRALHTIPENQARDHVRHNQRFPKHSQPVPRHNEINEQLAKSIIKKLGQDS